jgi:hypothetical protein
MEYGVTFLARIRISRQIKKILDQSGLSGSHGRARPHPHPSGSTNRAAAPVARNTKAPWKSMGTILRRTANNNAMIVYSRLIDYKATSRVP